MRSHYGFDVEIVVPDRAEVEAMVRQSGPNLFLDSRDNRLRCCAVRKVAPFQRVVSGLRCWISGLRRGQGGARQDVGRVEIDRHHRADGSLVKVNPLVDWSEERVWDYIRGRGVPYHALYDEGYRSIGCAPCTRASRPGESARDGRWWWESGVKECGLHSAGRPIRAGSELGAGP